MRASFIRCSLDPFFREKKILEFELKRTLRRCVNGQQEQHERHSPTEELEMAIRTLLQCTQELRLQLQQTALEQASDLIESSREDANLVGHLRAAALALDGDRFDECGERFQEHIDHVQVQLFFYQC